MYVHRGNIKRLFAGKENPTNIRAAFKKDFKLGKSKDSEVQELKENPGVKLDGDVNNSEIKDVKIMGIESAAEHADKIDEQ